MQCPAQAGFTLVEIVITMGIMAILATVAVSAYKNYKTRAKITEGLVVAAAFKAAVTEHYLMTGEWETDPSVLALDAPDTYSGDWLKSISLGAGSDGAPVAITISYNESALHELGANNTIVLYPVMASENISWHCDGGTVDDKFRPAQCKATP